MLRFFQAVFLIAIRNLFARKVTFIVGMLVFVSTAILILVTTFRQELQRATSQTLINAFVGHAQVFSSASTGSLALYDAAGGSGDEDAIAPLAHFDQIRAKLLQIPNVNKVVPMGSGTATYIAGSLLDELLNDLRAVLSGRSEDRSRLRSASELKEHIRYIVGRLALDAQGSRQLVDTSVLDELKDSLARANTDEFWNDFDRSPFVHLEFLENKISPLLENVSSVSLSYFGVDLGALPTSFEQVEIVDGQPVPPGHRGILLSKFVYETTLKLRFVTLMDMIADAVDRGRSLSDDDELQQWARLCRVAGPELLLRLPPSRSAGVLEKLRPVLKDKAGSLDQAVTALLDLTPDNFREHYRLFYDVVAPLIDLYSIKPGDLIPIRAHARSGYIKSLRVRFYGTYKLKGLSAGMPPARDVSLIDLVSMNELLGYLTPEDKSDIQKIEDKSSFNTQSREEMESAIFASPNVTTATDSPATSPTTDPPAVFNRNRSFREQMDRTYTTAEMESGTILHAAIWLKDPAQSPETLAQIKDVAAREQLGITVVPWETAAGEMRSTVAIIALVLLIVVGILFLMVGAVLNNTVMMLMLQRVKELGTLRALGGTRQFVLALVLVESLLLMLVFGSAGAATASLFIHWLGQRGLPAPSADVDFMFGGRRLYPSVSVGSVVVSLAIVVVVGLIATLYPAYSATKIPPIRAMQTED